MIFFLLMNLSSLMLCSAVLGQSSNVLSAEECRGSSGPCVRFQPHFPSSAFIKNRLIPISIRADQNIQILSVSVLTGESCRGVVDPYYTNTFHIHCEEPGSANFKVNYLYGDSESLSSQTGRIPIFDESLPVSEASP